VLPEEWYASWPTQSLRAGALVVIQYAAYHIFYNARHPQEGCAVCDDSHCQVFGEDGCNTTATDSAINYVDDYYYETSGGTFFETCYAAGNENSDYGHSGRMRQKGSKYWANQGKSWTWMMNYYYTNSNYNIPITSIVRKAWS